MATQQTTQQKRAQQAWKDVKDVQNKSFAKEYGSLVRGLPAMIQTDGLGPALAFLLAKHNGKPESAHGAAYTHISSWVMQYVFNKENADLLSHLLSSSSSSGDYRRATTEAQAYLIWLKRFAEAFNLGEG